MLVVLCDESTRNSVKRVKEDDFVFMFFSVWGDQMQLLGALCR